MSALSFLSKKSWHTGLHQNQEAVWKAEKSALEERRKVDELRKERDREREIQELERLQEEAGGKKKRVEKVDWMYNAPASGSNVDKNELEDYLLGKKRVDKLLKADEGLQHSRGNQEGPIAEQKAIGSDRDVAAKVREDPMFAIRQQEQAAYQALLKDPARLRAMKKAAGMGGPEESKEERRRRKEEKRRRKEREEGRSYHRDQREDDGSRGRYERQRYEDREGRGSSSDRRRPDDYHHRHYGSNGSSRGEGRYYDSRREEHPLTGSGGGSSSRYSEARRRGDSQQQQHHHQSRRPRSRSPPARRADLEADREAKLAAMQANASSLSSSRVEQLAKIKEEEEESARREQELRMRLQKSKEKGYSDGKGSFLVQQQRDLYGSSTLDLNERLRRSKEGLQRFDHD